MNGIFAVNKPIGMTSHDVVNLIRKITGEKRVGHGGTLDPLASGVLVIGVGREFTKQLDKYVKGEKEYMAEIMLGFESETDDEEGPIHRFSPQGKEKKPSQTKIQQVLKGFVGEIEQTPPLYSAIKINGKEAYKHARKGQTPQLASRTVEIKNIELLEYNYPILRIKVTTGPGVYIRSLARDIGRKLETGGYIKNLIRTRVNTFALETSLDLEKF